MTNPGPPNPPSQPPGPPTWNEPSEALKQLLVSTAGALEIARDPTLVVEAKRLLSTLHARAVSPAGTEGVTQIIGRRFATFPQPERSDSEWAAWWSDYHDALKDVPGPALEAAMAEWVKSPTAQFLPKPGELRHLARTTAYREGIAYETAQRAIEMEPGIARHRTEEENARINPPPTREIPPETDAADRARAVKWARDNLQRIKDAQRPAQIRPNYGKVDETGITPQLRALVEAQRAGEA